MVNNQALDASLADANARLDPVTKAELGQFMTPSSIARFMAELLEPIATEATLLDCGAGIGSLTIPAAQRVKPGSIEVWEIDPTMRSYLRDGLQTLGIPFVVHEADFVTDAVQNLHAETGTRFTHVVLNPPYRKINSASAHRLLLRKAGIETVNLYTAFLALAVLLARPGGQIVAIVPRSFCNGLYYKPFRRMLLRTCSIEHLHVFESRTKAFKHDEVLQENVILKLVRDKKQENVTVSVSHDHNFDGMKMWRRPFTQVVQPSDNEAYFHIPADETRSAIGRRFPECELRELEVDVCTGPVVDFRLREHWLADYRPGSVPLLYPHHFAKGQFVFPKAHRKPNALRPGAETSKWSMPSGWYVLIKRFSSKEEKRRVVAYLLTPDMIDSDRIGFENHLNVVHAEKHGLDPLLAKGLACYLNSTKVDQAFRVFSGHTQVNATDLRNMKYPSAKVLRAIGARVEPHMSQDRIDALVESAADGP